MTGSSPESSNGQPPSWLEHLLEHLQDLGLSPHLIERFVSWWRRYGLVKTLVLSLAVFWPLLQFEILPGATSSLVETLAEAQGLRLKVEDWSFSLATFSATAHGVVIETGGRYAQPFVLRAAAIEVDASLWQNLSDGIGRLKRRAANAGRWVSGRETIPLPPRPVGRAVTVTGGDLYLERLISGRGNWQDAFIPTASPGADDDAASEPFYVPVLELEDFKVTYVEHLPAESASGLEQSLTSTFHLDEATLTVGDFVGPADARDNPTDFSLDGRVADGRVSVTGRFNLWAPAFAFNIGVSNVGAATLGVMSPEASIVPASGTMTGHVILAMKDNTLRECTVNVEFQDVRYRVNPRSPFMRTRQRIMQAQLDEMRVSGPVQAPCSGDWADPSFRPLWAAQASMTAQALQDAPPAVQSAARFDQKRFSEALSPEGVQAELQRAAGSFTDQVGAQVGQQTGNAVSRGLAGVGRGVGRLFGRKPR